jgi:hypothetical protein
VAAGWVRPAITPRRPQHNALRASAPCRIAVSTAIPWFRRPTTGRSSAVSTIEVATLEGRRMRGRRNPQLTMLAFIDHFPV